MNVLIDTNVLARSAQTGHPMNQTALDAVDTLRQQGSQLWIGTQNLIEFWAVATRPLNINGLGMNPEQAWAEILRIKGFFLLLPDVQEIYLEWERLVTQYAVSGRNAHDARIAAAMKVHGMTHLLTFNAADFKRFLDITVLNPDEIVASLIRTN